MEELSEIIPGLYIGGLSSLALLEPMRITHVLSAVPFPLQKDLTRYTTLQLALQDTEAENLLLWLPSACRFLDTALGSAATPPGVGPASCALAAPAADGPSHAVVAAAPCAEAPTAAAAIDVAAAAGELPLEVLHREARVLVHCQAGMSRSPAVVAAWLMRSRGHSYFDAMKLIRARRPVADPNDGFVAQLQLFEDMRCTLDMDHPVYRMWALEQVGRQWEEEGFVDPDTFGQLPEGNAAAASQGLTLYRCRKCRTLLATSSHAMPVEAAMGHKVFRARQRVRREQAGGPPAAGGDSSQQEAPGDSSLFLQPMQWMASTVTGVVQGKLYCPGSNCGARLGSFNWSGITNTSGAWITPAFQLHHSKVDTLEPKPLEALATVRRPLVGPAAVAAVAAVGAAPGGLAAGHATALAATASGPVVPPTLPEALRRAAMVPDCGVDGNGIDEPQEEVRWQEEEPQAEGAAVVERAAAALALSATPSQVTPAQGGQHLPQRQQQSHAEAEGDEAAQPHHSDVAPGSSSNSKHQGTGSSSIDADSCIGAGSGDGSGSGCGGCHGAQQAQPGASLAAAAAPAPPPPQLQPSSTSWFTHLLLDCDGVMVDSEVASCEALRRAILQVTGFDIPHAFPGDYVEVFGMDVRSCVAHYREKFSRDDWEAPEALAPRVQAAKEVHYRELTSGGIQAFDGAERLMRRALAAGMQLGVASSGAPEKIHRNLSSSGLLGLLQPHTIVSASSVPAGKPAPDVYIAAMKATGCMDPARALVVEDAVNGLKAARAAGAYTVGITNQLPREVLEPWADEVVAHLDELDLERMAPPGDLRPDQ